MPYCITLRSRTDARITGWYVDNLGGWSTDHKRQRLFDQRHDARPVCHKLRNLFPRNAKFINIEVARDDLSLDVVPTAPDRDPPRR
jgi:hypothetical protein